MSEHTINNQNEREISLKVLFFTILRKWKIILCISILVSLAAMSYKGYKIYKSNSSATINTATTVETEKQSKIIEDEISDTKESIDYLDDYIEHSILAKIDPYNESATTSSISIISSSDDLTPLAETSYRSSQLVQVYCNYINNEIDYSSLEDSLGITTQEIKELITVTPNFDANIATIKVIATDSKVSEEIMSYISNQINLKEQELKTEYGDFSSVKSKYVSNIIIDNDLMSAIPSNTSSSYSNNKVMMNALAKKVSLESTLSSQQKNLDSLTSTNSIVSTSGSSKTIIKYGIAGLVGGIFVTMLLYAFKLSVSGIIFSENDIKSIYNFKILSIFPMILENQKLSKFDRYIYSKIDNAYGIGWDISVEKAALNISAVSNNMKTLTLISPDALEDLGSLVAKLHNLNSNINFIFSTNINKDAIELEKLKNTDGVLLVVERNKTKIDNLETSLETISNWNKTIVGCIIL